MEAWAGVSASSIYVMLKKLEARGFVSSRTDVEKRTKGATGLVYSVLAEGRAALLHSIKSALSTCREHDPRFNIALSGLESLDHETVAACLTNRGAFLKDERARLTATEQSQANLPFSARLLFDHIKYGIDAEIRWLGETLSELREGPVRNAENS